MRYHHLYVASTSTGTLKAFASISILVLMTPLRLIVCLCQYTGTTNRFGTKYIASTSILVLQYQALWGQVYRLAASILVLLIPSGSRCRYQNYARCGPIDGQVRARSSTLSLITRCACRRLPCIVPGSGTPPISTARATRETNAVTVALFRCIFYIL